MESQTLVENELKNGEIEPKDQSYIEIEIPYNLFQFLSTDNCNIQNICRICLSTNSDVLYPLLSAEENSFLADMFMSLTTVKLTPEDALPSSICEPCQTLVVQYYEFKIKCEKSDCTLRSLLKGEFTTKEEPPDNSIATNRINEDTTVPTNEIKDEPNFDEDVQYLEDLSDDGNYGDKLYIVQDTGKRKKKKSRAALNNSNNLHSENVTGKNKPGRKSKSYTCKHCSKVFNKAKTFQMHITKKHVEKRAHPCSLCKKSFNSEHDLLVHSALHAKGAGNVWKCNQCQKEFTCVVRFRRHLPRHMQHKAHACGACDKTFTELYALRRHARVHTGERPEKKHACQICDKKYTDSSLLTAHMSRHIDLRPFECDTCGKGFPSQRLLTSHALIHTDSKPFACDYCDKRFRHESTRNTHHRTHTGEKPYVCSVCGKNFIQNSNLTLHMRTHTGERPYSCRVCERKFTSGSSLKTHQRVHTGERPYSCEICGKKFARMSLNAHMRRHTGDRPFPCTACPKKFITASRLRDHCRIHTGEKPYECAYCAHTFTTKSHLIKHMKTHNSKKNKKTKRELVFVQEVACDTPAVAENIIYAQENGDLISVIDNSTIVDPPNNIDKNITLDLQEVPLEVTGELILPESNMKAEVLVVDNSQNNYQISNDDICLNAGNVNIINGDVDYGNDVNLVTVNEGGVSISASTLEGTTVKLYQLDQSLVQIHSSGGQVTISKITSKMTANF